MSSKSVQIIGGPSREHAWVDAPTNALLVKVVNPGGGGGGVQYNEDTAHVTGDTGTMALVVRKDAAGSLVSADGDYAPLQVDATGALRVTSTGGGGGGTQYQEDAAHTTGDTGTLALVVRQDTPGSLVSADGDYASLQVDATGRLRVTVDASVPVAVTQSTSPWVVSGTVAVSNFPATQPVSGTVTALQGTSPWVVGDGGGSLTVDGTVAVSNFPATVNVAQGTVPWECEVFGVEPGTNATQLGKASGSSSAAGGDVGVAAMAIESTDGLYYPLSQTNFHLKTTTNLVVPGTGATNLGKAEDAIHTTGDVGVMALAVRQDAVSALAADGDYIPLSVNATGHLRIEASGSGITNLGKAAGAAYTFSGEVGTALMTIDSGTLTWQPVLSTGNTLQVGGTVAVSGVIPGTGATSLGKIEDAAHTTGDVGVMALAVRNDSGAVLAGATGDYIPLTTDSGGRLRVLTTQSATEAVFVFGHNTGLGMEIFADLDAVGGGPTAQGPPVMFETVSTNPAIGIDNRWNHAFIDSNDGGIYVHVANTATVSISGHTPGTGATSLGKAEDAGHTTGDVGVMALAVRQDTLASSTSATGDYAALKVDSLGALYVNMGNPTSLADGQLATTIGTLLTAGGYTQVLSIDLFNTSSSTTEIVKLYLKQSGGTRRQVRQYSLQPGESVQVIDGDSWNLESGDLIEGVTTNATTVDYFITGLAR